MPHGHFACLLKGSAALTEHAQSHTFLRALNFRVHIAQDNNIVYLSACLSA